MATRAGVRSFDHLLALASDKSARPRARAAACRELGSGTNRPVGRNLARAVRALLRACQTDDRQLARAAGVALAAIGGQGAVRPLIRLMARAPTPATREAAAYALGFLHDRRALRPLISVLRNRSEVPAVRGQAAEGIGLLGQATRLKHPVQPLLEALQDESVEVRFWAAYALSQYRDGPSIRRLRRLTSDRAVLPGWWSVGREARWSIAVLEGDPKADAIWEENIRRGRRKQRGRIRVSRG